MKPKETETEIVQDDEEERSKGADTALDELGEKLIEAARRSGIPMIFNRDGRSFSF
ncbi:MAG: hypothetical protein R3B52_02035 [Candidatus Paceibacterota bacterium]